MTTDIPDPDDYPYAFSNGLMPYDRIHDMPDETMTRGEAKAILERGTARPERLRVARAVLAELEARDALPLDPAATEPAAIHVGQGDEQT